MKKLKILLIGIICSILIPINVEAASGNISVTGASTAIVGNKVTITVTLSSGTSIGSWQMDLNYDKNYLQLTNSSAEGGGTRMVNSSATGVKSKSYTFTFKALKSGNTRISVSSYLAYAFSDISEINLTSGSKNIRIMTQQELEASYSKDNNLKSLSVEGYELDTPFDKDTLEYRINVPTGTTSVKITAIKNDSKASVTGDGEIEVTEGLNTLPIIVTAENGSEKTYNLIVNVEDQNPIEVTVDNKDFTIVKNENLLTAPNTFVADKIIIDDLEIPAFKNTAADITLVGLKDSSGEIGLFIYKDGKYSKYNEMNLNHILLIPVPLDKELDFNKGKVNINGEEIDCYKINDNSEFVIINAKSLSDGNASYYLYDTENNTVIRYDEDLISTSKETLKLYSYVIIAFASTSFLMLIIIICLLHSSKKKQKKINKFIERQEAKIEATRKLNDVVSEVQKITAKEKEDNKVELEKTAKINLEETKKIAKVEEEKKSEYDKADLTGILDTLSKEKLEATQKLEIDKNELSKKELKELKKLEKKKAKEKKKNKKHDEEINIKKINVNNQNVTDNVSDDTEEVYDLFGDD